MILPILTVSNPENIATLRRKCDEVVLFGEPLVELVQNMTETMLVVENGGPRGVGLAAPQIGECVNLFVMMTPKGLDNRTYETMALVNPRIVEIGKYGDYLDVEGCLSIPGLLGSVERHKSLRVAYQDVYGQTHEEVFSGFIARVFQHEFDHLNGRLYIDIAKEVVRKKTV